MWHLNRFAGHYTLLMMIFQVGVVENRDRSFLCLLGGDLKALSFDAMLEEGFDRFRSSHCVVKKFA